MPRIGFQSSSASRLRAGAKAEDVDFSGPITLTDDGLVYIELRPDMDYDRIVANTKPTRVVRGIIEGFSLPVFNDDNGKNVKWQIDYQTSAAGDPVSGNHAGSPKTVEDAYIGAVGWVEHHTAAMTIAAADFLGKHHILLKISAVEAPAVVLTCEPHLICICYSYTAKWGRKP